jgi:anti-anti-sigma factor
MSITVNVHGQIANIILSGEIDYSSQEAFREAANRAVTAADVQEIRVHFSEVTFVDSSCIRALLTLQKQADQRDIPVRLVDCNDPIRDIFEIGGFDTMFTFL